MRIIAVADLHLREDVPRCRGETEEQWMKHQRERLVELRKELDNNNTYLLIAGDIFHRSKPPLEVVSMFTSVFAGYTDRVGIMAGNHDLKYNNHGDSDTGYAILESMFETFTNLCSAFGHILYGKDALVSDVITPKVVGIHTLLFETEDDVPYGVKHFETAQSLADKFQYPYLIVGDMHRPFVRKVNDTWVVNCGSLTVQSINENEYPHGFWVFDTNKVGEPEFTPYTNEVLLASKTTQETTKERDKRIGILVEGLKGYESVVLDFEENVRKALTKNPPRATVKNVIERWTLQGGTL